SIVEASASRVACTPARMALTPFSACSSPAKSSLALPCNLLFKSNVRVIQRAFSNGRATVVQTSVRGFSTGGGGGGRTGPPIVEPTLVKVLLVDRKGPNGSFGRAAGLN